MKNESQNIEYKETWRDDYLKCVCGFANAQGGKIYIGVNDAREVVGVDDSKKLMEDIPNKIVTHLGIVADVNLLKAEGLDYIEYFTGVEFQIGRFGKDEGDLLEQDIIDGNIIQMADKVMEVLRFKYLHASIRFEGMQRIETLEIPDKAFIELLYNSIVHKLYMGAAVQMHVYDDRIEVGNDGTLPEGYTPETLMQRHASKPRNKNIAFAFFKAGFIDRWGLGYKKIMEGFKTAGLKLPTIELVDGGVKVTVWRQNVTENVATLSKLFKVSERTIKRDLAKLQTLGVVRRDGPDKGGK